ncbi:Rv3654c family TadE-like protein [Microbacterium xanthum]|uniref:Rv3654c family TadE-like protein n=1 Tax=Microbacterium xanthum TaxID=3079794 RepID=UPI002AD336EB|nr:MULTISPECIES: Rv3654c family TadE-like protein [unclassified Microbacterium]MDZ8171895.1 helicase [Microbacterium sp. KSW-48]MDZ8200008.1 helicase [Microbacterium sp. SSW1-59]
MPGAPTVVGVVAALATLIGGLASVGAASASAQRLSGAADAAALAAADAASGAVSGVPCERAAEVAEAHAVTVVSCEAVGLIVTVTLASRFAGMPFEASARAGPPPVSGPLSANTP